MATNNSINAPLPLSATQGGLGGASPTAHGILIGQGASAVTSTVLTAGQILIGTTSGDPAAATLSAGSGISINTASGSITISATASNFAWTGINLSNPIVVTANSGYYATVSVQATFTLDTSTITAGQVFAITSAASNTGGWRILQGANQKIVFGNVSTTVGTGGSITSTSTTGGDTMYFLCVSTTEFVVTGAVGNFTVV